MDDIAKDPISGPDLRGGANPPELYLGLEVQLFQELFRDLILYVYVVHACIPCNAR